MVKEAFETQKRAINLDHMANRYDQDHAYVFIVRIFNLF